MRGNKNRNELKQLRVVGFLLEGVDKRLVWLFLSELEPAAGPLRLLLCRLLCGRLGRVGVDGDVVGGVRGRRAVALVGFTTDGDVFGGFHRRAVTEQHAEWFDATVFAFSFEAHGRCMTPQRFPVKRSVRDTAFVCFNSYDVDGWFVQFWSTEGEGFGLGNERSSTYCWNPASLFEALSDDTLTGHASEPFHCHRLLAVLLE